MIINRQQLGKITFLLYFPPTMTLNLKLEKWKGLENYI